MCVCVCVCLLQSYDAIITLVSSAKADCAQDEAEAQRKAQEKEREKARLAAKAKQQQAQKELSKKASRAAEEKVCFENTQAIDAVPRLGSSRTSLGLACYFFIASPTLTCS